MTRVPDRFDFHKESALSSPRHKSTSPQPPEISRSRSSNFLRALCGPLLPLWRTLPRSALPPLPPLPPIFPVLACFLFLHSHPQLSTANQPETSCQLAFQGLLSTQIEPGSLKNFAAQLKEGARAARFERPQFFSPPKTLQDPGVRSAPGLSDQIFCNASAQMGDLALFAFEGSRIGPRFGLICPEVLFFTEIHRNAQKIAIEPLAYLLSREYI
jgi:hypothetical protein